MTRLRFLDGATVAQRCVVAQAEISDRHSRPAKKYDLRNEIADFRPRS
jgi:hypothetical protein